MTKKQRMIAFYQMMERVGFTTSEAETLLKAERALQRWHEMECGTGDDRVSVSVERDESYCVCTQCGHKAYGVEAETGNCQSCGDCAPVRHIGTGKPFRRVQYMGAGGKWIDRKEPCRDMEKAARKRVANVLQGKSGLSAYIQGDPRGCALYILREGDVPEGKEPCAYYSRGIPVCY
jgi:ribosomal protein L37E